MFKIGAWWDSCYSTAATYLRPAMKEAGSRLSVSADTLVHRVIFDGKRAVGIEYQTGGKGAPVKRAYASREVSYLTLQNYAIN